MYTGVVAWFCALKLELYASYVLDYDDLFGVFEWGAGGIVHMHLLGWKFPGFGRYDHLEGEVPVHRRVRDARSMAWQHGAQISEWNPARKSAWRTEDGCDVSLTEERAGGVPLLTDESDCDDEVSAPLPPASDTDGEFSCYEEMPDPPAVEGAMEELAALLRDAQWHPSAIPTHCKRVLLTHRSQRVRRMVRWYESRLLNKTHMHDRHRGEPVSSQAVYGDDDVSEVSSSDVAGSDDAVHGSGAEVAAPSGSKAAVRVVTWNCNLLPELPFVVEAAKTASVVCLQEVTARSAAWLQEKLGDRFDVITPVRCGAAWGTEGHGVAVAVSKRAFCVERFECVALPSRQQRQLLAVRLRERGGTRTLLVGTTHLESGVEHAAARAGQLKEACRRLEDSGVDAALLAGDFELAWRGRQGGLGRLGRRLGSRGRACRERGDVVARARRGACVSLRSGAREENSGCRGRLGGGVPEHSGSPGSEPLSEAAGCGYRPPRGAVRVRFA